MAVTEDPAARKKSRAPAIIALGLLAVAGLGFAAWQVYQRMNAGDATTVAAGPGDAAVSGKPATADAKATAAATADASTADSAAAVASKDAGTIVDAATAVAVAVDAAAVVDGGKAATPPPDTATAAVASDSLTITSTPAGAHVYLDGAETGVTPLKLPASADRHTVALLLAGHELYIAQVDGSGAFAIPLKEVTPPGGPAGIKVLKCKDKDRYYVFLDGKPTGQMCPTERIDTDVGAHTIEVYDAVTETRKKFDVVVKDTRLSVRVKIE